MAVKICEHSTVRSPHPAGDLDKPPSAMYYETTSPVSPLRKTAPHGRFLRGRGR